MSLNTHDAERAIGARLRVLRGDQASGKRYETMPGAKPRLMHSWTRPGTNDSDVNPIVFGCNHCGLSRAELMYVPPDAACRGTKVGLPGYEPCSRCGLKSVVTIGRRQSRCLSCVVTFNRASRHTGWRRFDFKAEARAALDEAREWQESQAVKRKAEVERKIGHMTDFESMNAAFEHDVAEHKALLEKLRAGAVHVPKPMLLGSRETGLKHFPMIKRNGAAIGIGDGVALFSTSHPHPDGCQCDICIPF